MNVFVCKESEKDYSFCIRLELVCQISVLIEIVIEIAVVNYQCLCVFDYAVDVVVCHASVLSVLRGFDNMDVEGFALVGFNYVVAYCGIEDISVNVYRIIVC